MSDPGGIYRPGRSGSSSMKSGTLAVPGMSFSDDTLTGFYWVAPDVLGIGSHGYSVAQFSSTVATIPNLTSSTLNATSITTGNLSASNISISGPLSAIDGSAANPAYTFASSTNSGLFKVSGGWGLSASGTLTLSSTNTLITSVVPIRGPNGSVTNCSFGFTSSAGTGLFSPTTGQWTLSAAGVTTLSSSSISLSVAVPLTAQGISAQALSSTGLTAPTLVSPLDATTNFSFVGSTWVLTAGGVAGLTGTSSTITAARPIILPVGSVANPAMALDTGTGFYKAGPTSWGLCANGITCLTGTSTAVTATVPFSAASYLFSADTASGLSQPSVGSWALKASNITTLSSTNSLITAGATLQAVSGTAALTSFGFTSSAGTGMYLSGTNTWGLAAGGTLTVSGNSTEITSAIPFGGLVKTANKTANYTIQANESGKTFDCVGATATVTFTLPTAVPGLQFTFVNSVNLLGSGTTLKAAGTDTIRISGTSSAGGTQTSTVLAATVTLTCITAGKWVNTGGFVGLWVAL